MKDDLEAKVQENLINKIRQSFENLNPNLVYLLKSVYHQVPLIENDMKYTAFDAFFAIKSKTCKCLFFISWEHFKK